MSSLAPPPPANTTTAGSGRITFSSSSGYSSSLFLRSFKVPIARNPNHRHAVSCNTLDDHDHHGQDSSKVDRRNVLLGLGGLYGAATTFGSNSSAFADPISPDVTKCGPPDLPSDVPTLSCCPPPSQTEIIDFQLPPQPTKLRIRKPAQWATREYTYAEEFKEAIRLMKNLRDDDPRSFKQQAAIHCAYCDGAYYQVGFPDLKLQVHSSWLFLPFHRCYLYFFEKICGELLKNPDFALPYWNWDAKDGMKIPEIYTDKDSPLYDPRRDALHQPPVLVNLHYDGVRDEVISNNDQVHNNLITMYQQVCEATTPRLFMGDPYRAGCMPPTGAGYLERVPHGTVHDWTGDRTQPNHEDMGIFYAAARDPIFYAHHANVDRIWTLWKTLDTRNVDFPDNDWLNSSFVFYNEKRQMVRIKVRDCLDTEKLGYAYEDVGIPWRYTQPIISSKRVLRKVDEKMAPLGKDVLPTSLDKVIKVLVRRPKTSRTKEEKDAEVEVLVIEGIELKKNVFMKFDVFVNDEDEGKGGTNIREFAGSFVHVPHRHDHGESTKTKLSLGISQMLEDLDIEGDDHILVTLVPKSGGDDISIGGIRIEFD